MKQNIVAIDGPAGAGKSTVAKKVAEKLSFLYIDTGAMYRAAALALDRYSFGNITPEKIKMLTREITMSFSPAGNVLLDGIDVSKDIRTYEISRLSSVVSSYPAIRRKLVKIQQSLGCNGKVVMEGRDIGSVVFPNACCKIFLTASPDERARRRTAQLTKMGEPADFEAIRQQIIERDMRDTTRKDSPLVKADDAVLLDTDNLTIHETVERIIDTYKCSIG